MKVEIIYSITMSLTVRRWLQWVWQSEVDYNESDNQKLITMSLTVRSRLQWVWQSELDYNESDSQNLITFGNQKNNNTETGAGHFSGIQH